MNMAMRAKIDKGGRIVIPAEIRQQLGVCAGDTVLLRLNDGELRIYTLDHAARKARAIVRKYVPEGISLADELIAERRTEAERE
jgi:AbrB family looped-hinge helix DNA binding protein